MSKNSALPDCNKEPKKVAKFLKPTMSFILIMGFVSLFSDMTHEGAKSILGAYLALAGASASAIGFVSGLGELVGYSFRLLTGFIADKTKKYWLLTIIGYILDCLAIPALALIPQNGWILACALIILQRAGKAIKKPAKNTLVSFAASDIGTGKSFALLEFIDQIGAFLGPMLLFLIMLFTTELGEFKKYAICFAALGIPALICIVLLLIARKKYPHPENFEKEESTQKGGKLGIPFIVYLIAICIFAFGFIDFPLITMHETLNPLIKAEFLPLLYSFAMIIDAFAALIFGWFYDKKGFISLAIAVTLSSTFSIFIFSLTETWAAIVGIAMWGIGMGAQESIMKSAVSTISSKESRSKSFGMFETFFGISWFLGSWLMGHLYEVSIIAMVVLSTVVVIIPIPLFLIAERMHKKEKA